MMVSISLLIAGCTTTNTGASATPSATTTPAPQTVTVIDDRGMTITVPYPCKRIVFLVENAMNTMYAIGGADDIVGIGDIWMPQYKEAFFRAVDPDYNATLKISTSNGADLEALAKAKPDLVVLWSADWNDKDTKAISENLHVPVYGVYLRNFSDIYKQHRDFAKITGNEQRGQQVLDTMNATMKKVTDVTATIPDNQKPTVYWMWGDVYGTAGLHSSTNDLINAAGGKNVLNNWNNDTKYDEHPVLTMEAIQALNPDVIYMWYNPKLDPKDVMTGDDFKAWRNISAVKNGRVYELNDPFLDDSMTSRLPLVVMKIAKNINPDKFASLDLNKEYDAFFVSVYGVHYPGYAKA
ncbi:MAG TPA: ABC transporter substrate-binding protein [Methanocella sp.]|uniref:ABC transporter substrate-binding protein n=1 Tax=Methanocella sp. TaxID=2052833 RepID=UPI002C2DD80B|nr:ABC transporter substrate-binding protein [Methanocella sp.]HTY91988.1 ABC transporter substrate-binding protein [Methanocella sp.]